MTTRLFLRPCSGLSTEFCHPYLVLAGDIYRLRALPSAVLAVLLISHDLATPVLTVRSGQVSSSG